MNNLTIFYKGKLFNIQIEPFECIEDTFKRGWFIIKNYNNYKNNYNELYSLSLMMINKDNNMTY
jgi:hypothetical protein